MAFLTAHLKDNPEIEAIGREALSKNIPAVQRESADLIRLLIRTAKIQSILEIGTAVGYSTCLFYDAMEKGRIVTIERRPDLAAQARANFKRMGFNGITVLEGDANAILPTLEENFELIFIDAGKSHYREYFDKAFPFLKPGGLIISDNILMNGLTLDYDLDIRKNRTMVKGMRNYLHFLCNHPELHTTLIPIGDGLAVSLHDKEQTI